jgi:hypothetical protein
MRLHEAEKQCTFASDKTNGTSANAKVNQQ